MTALTGHAATRARTRSVEWPSVALCAGVYGAFGAVTWFADRLPSACVVVSLALLVTLHSSMQHEFIHGHPTAWRRLNRALAAVPLSLWLPFETYRRSHLVHHRNEQLTDPLDDPESNYWTPTQWRQLGPLGRAIVRAHSTLMGRLLLGPAWTISRFLRSEGAALVAGDRVRRRIWLRHGLAVALLLVWILAVCRIDPRVYGAAAYLGTAVLLLRSYAEHRANDDVVERTAIVENAWIFGPLFLFNNLHAAHHERPLLPWYELPRWYRANRARLVRDNGGLVYDGYGEVARRFLFTPHHVIIHPTMPARAGDGVGAAAISA